MKWNREDYPDIWFVGLNHHLCVLLIKQWLILEIEWKGVGLKIDIIMAKLSMACFLTLAKRVGSTELERQWGFLIKKSEWVSFLGFGLNCYLTKLWKHLRNVRFKFFKNLKSHFSWHTGVFSSFRQLFKKLLLKKIGSQNGWKKQESSKSLKSILFPLYPCFSSALEKNCSKKK